MPEYFRSGDGIALREDVKPGVARLYIYHCPQPDAGSKVISSVLENMSDRPLKFTLLRRAFPKPGGNYYKIGKSALAAYFDAAPAPPKTLAPHQRMLVDPEMDQMQVTTDQLVHGIYEFQIDQPVRIFVFQRDPKADSTKIIDNLPLLRRIVNNKPSGAGRGVFLTSDYSITADTIDTANGLAQLIVADGKTDPWIRGRDSIDNINDGANKGNYGVMYHITLKFKSSDNRALAVLFTNPHPGESCGGAAAAVTVNDGVCKGGMVRLPADRINIKLFPECALIQRFATPGKDQVQEIQITYSPPGASCLPTPILLVPYVP